MRWNSSGTALKVQPARELSEVQVMPSDVVGRWSELGITTDPVLITGLNLYLAELHRFNKRLNLVSSATLAKADAVHIGDAVRAWGLLSERFPSDALIYDFGSGNGVPGLVFALMESLSGDGRRFRLIDRDQRKLEFLKHVAFKLGLKNISFSNTDVAQLPDGSVSFAVARGFAPVTAALLTTSKCIGKGGELYMLKSEGWSREVADIPTPVFGTWQVEMVGQYKLPETAAEYVLIRALRTGA